jgi:hypothetical protein
MAINKLSLFICTVFVAILKMMVHESYYLNKYFPMCIIGHFQTLLFYVCHLLYATIAFSRELFCSFNSNIPKYITVTYYMIY